MSKKGRHNSVKGSQYGWGGKGRRFRAGLRGGRGRSQASPQADEAEEQETHDERAALHTHATKGERGGEVEGEGMECRKEIEEGKGRMTYLQLSLWQLEVSPTLFSLCACEFLCLFQPAHKPRPFSSLNSITPPTRKTRSIFSLLCHSAGSAACHFRLELGREKAVFWSCIGCASAVESAESLQMPLGNAVLLLSRDQQDPVRLSE